MAKTPSVKTRKVSVTIRIQRTLHADVKTAYADKFRGGFTEITERLLVGQMQTPGGLADRFPAEYVRNPKHGRNGK